MKKEVKAEPGLVKKEPGVKEPEKRRKQEVKQEEVKQELCLPLQAPLPLQSPCRGKALSSPSQILKLYSGGSPAKVKVAAGA